MFEKAQMLTSRYDEAFRYAHDLNRHQTRKGTNIPYISHRMTVSALVVEYGGNEDRAIGASLHDAAEDQVKQRSTRSGAVSVMPSPRSSKTARTPGSSTNRNGDCARRLIHRSACEVATFPARVTPDKTHNAEAILSDYPALGERLWPRFTGGADGTRWSCIALTEVFENVIPGGLSDRLTQAVRGFAEPLAPPPYSDERPMSFRTFVNGA
jgi:hypothetical protein